jgi:hypothetical protein
MKIKNCELCNTPTQVSKRTILAMCFDCIMKNVAVMQQNKDYSNTPADRLRIAQQAKYAKELSLWK